MAVITLEHALDKLVEASHIPKKDHWIITCAEADLKTYREHAKDDPQKIYIEAYKARILDANYKIDGRFTYGPKTMAEYDLVIAAVRLHELSVQGKPLPDLTKPESFNKFISQSLTHAHYCKEKAETHFWNNWGHVKDDGEMPQQGLFFPKKEASPATTHITFDSTAQHHEPTAPPKKPSALPQHPPEPAKEQPGSHPKRPAPTLR